MLYSDGNHNNNDSTKNKSVSLKKVFRLYSYATYFFILLGVIVFIYITRFISTQIIAKVSLIPVILYVPELRPPWSRIHPLHSILPILIFFKNISHVKMNLNL